MRFLGPRSISSLLKTALDVVYYGLYGLVFMVILLVVCLLTVPSLAAGVVRHMNIATQVGAVSQALMWFLFGVMLSGYLLVMHWVRQIFSTLAEGDAFHPDNTARLRWIGFALGGLEIFGYVLRAFAEKVFHLSFESAYGLRAVTTWFSVLVVFVLAEVFKEGARLRQEADLTI